MSSATKSGTPCCSRRSDDWMTASTLKHYVEKPLRLACDPVCVSASRHTLLADNAREVVIGEILPITLIAPDPSFRTEVLDFKLIRSGLCIKRTPHLYFESGPAERRIRNDNYDGGPATFRREYEYSPSRAQRGNPCHQHFAGLAWVWRSDRPKTPILIRPRIESTSTRGTGCTPSAVITRGPTSGLTSNFSLLWRLIYRCHSAPEAFRSRTIYTDCTPNSSSRPVTAH